MKFVQLQSYTIYGSAYADHLERKGISVGRFYISKGPKAKFPSKKDVVKVEMKAVLKILCHFGFFKNAKVYCTGGQYSAMLVSRLFGRALGREHHLYLHNFYLHSLGNNKWVQKILRFLMNNNRLTLIAQTPGEIAFYRNLSHKMELQFVPYCSDVKERQNTIPIRRGYIFTGGYTNRDYGIMTSLARSKPGISFMFIASNLNNDIGKLPPNVTLKRNVSTEEFANLMERAAIVVVPLKEDVGSSGQMLCLQAMRYHKPIVYANVSSISYYFTKESGLPYKLGDFQSLTDAIDHLVDNETQAKEMGDKAFEESLKYTSKNSMNMIDDIIVG